MTPAARTAASLASHSQRCCDRPASCWGVELEQEHPEGELVAFWAKSRLMMAWMYQDSYEGIDVVLHLEYIE